MIFGSDRVQQQCGDGFIDQADRFKIGRDESPQGASKQSEEHHQRDQKPGWKGLKGQGAPGGKRRADI